MNIVKIVFTANMIITWLKLTKDFSTLTTWMNYDSLQTKI